MAKRMLIDATHPEETRVVVVSGNRLDEFDYESATKKPLKGNIYLAKVTRVEPSLQAAFVDYGGNRHGFLAFNEIHPDYYRVPVADRGPAADDDAEPEDGADEAAESAPPDTAEPDGRESGESGEDDEEGRRIDSENVEVLGGDEMEDIEAIEPIRQPSKPSGRAYKIQEVIKKRQIILVQVTKEERGNKGAALTTYLSLAGRYCVLMPNTPRGGGISRKVTNPSDRKRLKKMMEDLKIPDGLAIILRTAGVARSKAEIKRDYDYLVRLWSEIRETTLQSTAPQLIYEEGNLIKRAIRDLYTSEIIEVLVEGEDGYRTAKDFMRMLIPSHAKRVQKYKDEVIPLFFRYQVEGQLDSIHNPVIQLKSGGYIVLNPTEALVAIDVNSGRSTRERHIETTAHKTNLEAADEIARQLRLRDLAGLVVIDFIDMDEQRNNNSVERRFKEAMRNDRARIQVGRISAFGLLELSRQRLRPSLIEASTELCPSCAGTGVIRSTESTALYVLRHIEEEGIRKSGSTLEVFIPTQIAFYIFNQKRQALADIESRYNMSVRLTSDDSLIPPNMRIEQLRVAKDGDTSAAAVPADRVIPQDADEKETEGDGKERGRRRSKSRRRKPKVAAEGAVAPEQTEEAAAEEAVDTADTASADDEDKEKVRKGRRRGKRGGRRRSRRTKSEMEADEQQPAQDAEAATEDAPVPDTDDQATDEPTATATPPRRSRGSRARRRPADDAPKPDNGAGDSIPGNGGDEPPAPAPLAEPLPARAAEQPDIPAAAPESATPTPPDTDKPQRKGWWRNLTG